MGRMHGLAQTATHRWGTVSTVAETGLLGDTPDGWHHYAFIWKRDGVDFPEAKGKGLLLAIDAKIVASIDNMTPVLPHEFEQHLDAKTRLFIPDNLSIHAHPFVMSDFKIWDSAQLPTLHER